MISKLLFSLSLAVSPLVAVSAQPYQAVSAYDYTDFDTFHTEEDYLQDFDYLTEYSYRLSIPEFYYDHFDFDYTLEPYIFYVFPVYYDLTFDDYYKLYYQNENYNFFTNFYYSYEVWTEITINNYVGVETEAPFFALDYIGMNQVIEHDKEVKSNTISIYNSFYNFFTGFFPNEVVAEYHGIFTFIIVAFLLFLVFGFVFFLFRVIRRLVGFK